jgi:hypothetical protein
MTLERVGEEEKVRRCYGRRKRRNGRGKGWR